ncbi:MAG: hypothetical protein K1X72_18615 [Pyrinomonadaceae bacterium]|nr:hypothetical protein [Pyrinomonadaceae bacterium]
MLKKFTFLFLMAFTFFSLTPSVIFAKASGDWEKVKSLVNSEIAVNTKNGDNYFGKMISATDSEIVIQIADKTSLTNQNTTIQKDSVKKVWNAKLNFKPSANAKNIAIGTGVGAGAGIGIGIGLLFANTDGPENRDAIFAAMIAGGAAAGLALGYFFGKKGHKKLDMVYKV